MQEIFKTHPVYVVEVNKLGYQSGEYTLKVQRLSHRGVHYKLMVVEKQKALLSNQGL